MKGNFYLKNSNAAIKKKILIINCYFPEIRQPIRLSNEIPNTLSPVFLAGAFSSETCEINLYNEINSGFLELFSPKLIEWPDMIVFTGLTFSFDRMLQLAAYFKAYNEKVITVAGGQAIRIFRNHAKKHFDFACVGDIEEISTIIKIALGREYAEDVIIPRYDLAYWRGKRIGYVESSRNCNFRCTFCSLTGEGGRFEKKSINYLEQQITRLKKIQLLYFLDNQFYGNDRDYFIEKLELLKDLREKGYFKYWSAILTNDFLWDDEIVALAKESGCFSLFFGVESFDTIWLNKVNKKQNIRVDQLELIEKCTKAGILFQFGLVFDPSERSITSMKRELEYILSNPIIPTPLFFFTAIPFPGTPFFHKKYSEGRILPNTKARDLESSTLCLHPLENSIEETALFIKKIKYFVNDRRKILKHEIKFILKNKKHLDIDQILVSFFSTIHLFSPHVFSNFNNLLVKKNQRTHISTTESLDCVYTPIKQLPSKYAQYFEPTYITNEIGELNELILEDLVATRYKRQR